MKKLFTIIFLFSVFITQAQKVGYIEFNTLLSSLPGIDSVTIKLQDHQKLLTTQFEKMRLELVTKEKEYQEQVLTNLTKEVKEKEINVLKTSLDSFQIKANKELQLRQQQLLTPFYNKATAAITAVAEENKYSIIFNYDPALIIYRKESDNILPLVKQKLKIK